MIRILPFILELFLLPIVFYGLWLLTQHHNPLSIKEWRHAPWRWFFMGSAAAVVLTLLLLTHFEASDPQYGYTPAHIENGKLIPSQTR